MQGSIDDLEHEEEINIQPEQKEETRIFKNEERICKKTPGDLQKMPTSDS